MASASDILERKLLDHLLGVSTYTPNLPNWYLALLRSTTTDSMGGATCASLEMTYTGYDRVTLSGYYQDNATTSAGTSFIDNSSDMWFGENTGATTSTATHWAVLSGNAKTAADTLLMHGQLQQSRTISPSVTPVFAAGAMPFECQ